MQRQHWHSQWHTRPGSNHVALACVMTLRTTRTATAVRYGPLASELVSGPLCLNMEGRHMPPKLYSLHLPGAHSLYAGVWMAAFFGTAGVAVASPTVEFDFPRTIACVEVTPGPPIDQYGKIRLINITLPVSVRFHDAAMDDVDELHIEISGAAAGLRVYDFSPATQLASDVAQQIEATTTTKRARSLEGTLGGALPVPYAEIVAHLSPSITAGISGSEVATERMNRLPPKHAVVVSGTLSEGRGVFFKLKRSSQTSLEGVHALSVTFLVPANWRGGEVHASCSAEGQRKVLWMKQEATVGQVAGSVRLQMAGATPVYHVAKPVAVGPAEIAESIPAPREAARESIDTANSGASDRKKKRSPVENGATAGL